MGFGAALSQSFATMQHSSSKVHVLLSAHRRLTSSRCAPRTQSASSWNKTLMVERIKRPTYSKGMQALLSASSTLLNFSSMKALIDSPDKTGYFCWLTAVDYIVSKKNCPVHAGRNTFACGNLIKSCFNDGLSFRNILVPWYPLRYVYLKTSMCPWRTPQDHGRLSGWLSPNSGKVTTKYDCDRAANVCCCTKSQRSGHVQPIVHTFEGHWSGGWFFHKKPPGLERCPVVWHHDQHWTYMVTHGDRMTKRARTPANVFWIRVASPMW